MLFFTKYKFSNPDKFEPEEKEVNKFKISSSFVFYIIGISIFVFGFIDYSLVGMHIGNIFIGNSNIITAETLTLIYSLAMIIDAIAAIIFGKLYDKFSMFSLVIATICSSFFALFIFEFDNIVLIFYWSYYMGNWNGSSRINIKSSIY